MIKLVDAIEDKPELRDINRAGFIAHCRDGGIPFTHPQVFKPGRTSFEKGLLIQATTEYEGRFVSKWQLISELECAAEDYLT